LDSSRLTAVLVALGLAAVCRFGPAAADPLPALPDEPISFVTTPYTCLDGDVEDALYLAHRGQFKKAARKAEKGDELPEASAQFVAARYYRLAGDRKRWRKQLGKVAASESHLAPRASLELGLLYASGDQPTKAVEHLRRAAKSPALETRALSKLAQIHHQQGDFDAAVSAMAGALGAVRSRKLRDNLLYEYARLLESKGDETRSADIFNYLFFFSKAKGSAVESRVRKRVGEGYDDMALFRTLLVGRRSTWRSMLKSMTGAKKSDIFRESMLRGALAREVRGHKEEALPHFETAAGAARSGPGLSAALYFTARTLESLDRDLEARDIYDRLLRRDPDFPIRRQLLIRLAGVALREGLPLQAMAYLHRFLDHSFPGESRAEALWLDGFLHYLAGEWEPAVRQWELLEQEYCHYRRTSWEHFGAMARYWQARAWGRGGEAERHKALLESLARSLPGTYYGTAAAAGLRAAGHEVAEPGPARLERSPMEVPATVLLPEQFGAGVELFRLGLWDEAFEEFMALRARGHLFEDAVSLAASAYLRANALTDAVSLRRKTGALPAPWKQGARLWRTSLPLTYIDAIKAAGESSGLAPALMASIIRFESNFNPDVRSRAGAVGLLQVKRTTGNEVAVECLNRSRVSMKDLTKPQLNLELGSRYIAELGVRHHGNWAVALAAYNAGPGTARWWLARFAGLDADEFIEQITYPNTVGYVKRVLGTVDAYWSLHYPLLGESPPLPGLARTLPDGLRPFLDEEGGNCYSSDDE